MKSSVKKTMRVKKNDNAKEFRLFDFRVCSKVDEPDAEMQLLAKKSKSHNTIKLDESYFNIQMFGINEKGETCSIDVIDFKPFFYVKLPDNANITTVNNIHCDIEDALKDSCKTNYYKTSFNTRLVDDHNKLYGFTQGEKPKFILIEFISTRCFNKVKRLWNAKEEEFDVNRNFLKYSDKSKYPALSQYQLYESNIPPLLRFFHITNVAPSGWVKVRGTHDPSISTCCKYKYKCGVKKLIPLNNKEDSVPFKICSFDIEASSSHGDFPVPIKTYKKLATNIVDVFKNQPLVNEDNGFELLKKSIMCAFFKNKHCENVEKVYQKNGKSDESEIEKCIKKLDTSLEKIYKSSNDKINELIEQADEIVNKYSPPCEDEEINNTEFSVEERTTPSKPKKSSIERKFSKKTVLEVLLMKEKITRDEKITLIDKALMCLFPELEGDKVTFIGSTFMKYGQQEPYKNHCLVLDTCDKVKNVEIQSVTNEADILCEWAKLIQEEDPDIIIGYNIFGFDYQFMYKRAMELRVTEQFLSLSRIKTENTGHKPCSIENKKLAIASGEYDLRYYNIEGRLQIDMYMYFRRDFNLSSYKLDDVVGSYISDGIKHFENIEVNGEERCELYSANLKGLHINDFIHIELITFTTDYYNGGQKYEVLDIYEKTHNNTKYNVIVIKDHHHFEKKKKIKWGIAKDDVSPQDIFRLTNGTSADRAIVAKYCIQDCNLVHHLMNKIDVVTGFVEMSNICSVPIEFLVFRGQGIKLTSYVAKKCKEKKTLMPDLEKKENDGGYEGAIVLPPKCKMYMDNPVACVDYSSLYPSSMISQNYSHDSKVWTKTYDLEGNLKEETGEKDASGNFVYDNLPGFEYINTEFDAYEYKRLKGPKSREEKVKVGRKVCRWAQLPEGQQSIMPSILTELLKARKDTRKKIKTEPDPFMKNILDKRQLGYKVTANSLYGQCGARTSTFYEKDVAACTTATGRQMIMYARGMIEDVYGNTIVTMKNGTEVRTRAEYIYGDTDSVFYTFNFEDLDGKPIRGQPALEMTIELSFEVEKICSQFLKNPMYLEYEKTFMPFVLLSKKRYVGILYEDDPNKGDLKYMGLSLKRRDSCDYLKDTYGEIINILMRTQNLKNAIDYLNDSLQNLIQGDVNMDKLSITRALRSEYKNPQQIGHWVLSDRIGKRDPGNKPKPGDRIKYVFVVNKNKKALTGQRIETPEFIETNKLNIDYGHYITNQLMKPLQQLFGLAIEDIWKMQKKEPARKKYLVDMKDLQNTYENDLETFNKKKEKYCSDKIKQLLFDKKLREIEKINNKKELQENFKNYGFVMN